jgi:hypothetical protein
MQQMQAIHKFFSSEKIVIFWITESKKLYGRRLPTWEFLVSDCGCFDFSNRNDLFEQPATDQKI